MQFTVIIFSKDFKKISGGNQEKKKSTAVNLFVGQELSLGTHVANLQTEMRKIWN